MDEMNKLHTLLLAVGINHTFLPMDRNIFGDGALQIRIYEDDTFQKQLDDVVFHKFSNGYELGLLETFNLSDCEGYETAKQVFIGWMEKFFS